MWQTDRHTNTPQLHDWFHAVEKSTERKRASITQTRSSFVESSSQEPWYYHYCFPLVPNSWSSSNVHLRERHEIREWIDVISRGAIAKFILVRPKEVWPLATPTRGVWGHAPQKKIWNLKPPESSFWGHLGLSIAVAVSDVPVLLLEANHRCTRGPLLPGVPSNNHLDLGEKWSGQSRTSRTVDCAPVMIFTCTWLHWFS